MCINKKKLRRKLVSNHDQESFCFFEKRMLQQQFYGSEQERANFEMKCHVGYIDKV